MNIGTRTGGRSVHHVRGEYYAQNDLREKAELSFREATAIREQQSLATAAEESRIRLGMIIGFDAARRPEAEQMLRDSIARLEAMPPGDERDSALQAGREAIVSFTGP